MSLSTAILVLAFLFVVSAFAYTQPSTERRQLTLKTGLGILLVCGLLGYFRALLVPFLLPLLIAYLMDPVMDWFEAKGYQRWVGMVLVYLGVVAVGLLILLILVPPVVSQIADIAKQLATVDWGEMLSVVNIQDKLTWVVQHLPGAIDSPYKVRLTQNVAQLAQQWQEQLRQAMPYIQQAVTWLGEQAGSLVKWALSTVSGMVWLLLLPITLWYWLADFDKLRRRLWYIVPPERRQTVGALATASNKAIGGYIRGYALLCIMVGVVQTTILLILQSIFGFKYGLVIGVVAGCTYFIPYIGSMSSVFLGTAAIYLTGGFDLSHTLIGWFFLQVSNTVFDNVINPKIIGESTGLHPMLIMFALLAGGQMLGLAGVVLATPVLLCIKIVLEFYFPRLAEPIPDEENPDIIYLANAVADAAGDLETATDALNTATEATADPAAADLATEPGSATESERKDTDNP
ncbi:MAG: AI-2E family transporter [Armatimonadetes bacterium]|nr:AI-2E family transporter [Armatimonadota bacterium]